jgi:hypothetical protein
LELAQRVDQLNDHHLLVAEGEVLAA